MGIHDREYYRDEPPRGMDMSGPWLMVTKLVIVNLAIFVINKFITVGGQPDWLVHTLASNAADLTQPWMWWQFITCGFAHDPSSIWHVAFNMMALWFLGRDVELKYGTAEFLRFYLLAIVVSSVVSALENRLLAPGGPWPDMVGASGGVTAVVIVFICNFPMRTLLLWFVPVPAWLAGILIVLINVLGTRGVYLPTANADPATIAYGAHLAGAAFGLLYYFLGWNFGALFPRGRRFSIKSLKPGPRLKVHNPEDHYRELDDEGDRLLEKVKRQGIDSLSSAERRKLEDYSRRMQQKHR